MKISSSLLTITLSIFMSANITAMTWDDASQARGSSSTVQLDFTFGDLETYQLFPSHLGKRRRNQVVIRDENADKEPAFKRNNTTPEDVVRASKRPPGAFQKAEASPLKIDPLKPAENDLDELNSPIPTASSSAQSSGAVQRCLFTPLSPVEAVMPSAEQVNARHRSLLFPKPEQEMPLEEYINFVLDGMRSPSLETEMHVD